MPKCFYRGIEEPSAVADMKNNSDKANVHESRISLATLCIRAEERRRVIFTLISTFIQLRNKHGAQSPFNTVRTVVVLFPSSLSSKLDRAQVTVTADRLRLAPRAPMKLLVVLLKSQFPGDIKRNDRRTHIQTYNATNFQYKYRWKIISYTW